MFNNFDISFHKIINQILRWLRWYGEIANAPPRSFSKNSHRLFS